MASATKIIIKNNCQRNQNFEILHWWSEFVAHLAIDHHTFEEKRIAHDRVEGGFVLPCIFETFVPRHMSKYPPPSEIKGCKKGGERSQNAC